ncbi:MAG TPA: hypothetical protein VLM16_06180, partial [Ginsengibacter sp.]|nr:hypothetical protein [Ginsengibacter sp.]
MSYCNLVLSGGVWLYADVHFFSGTGDGRNLPTLKAFSNLRLNTNVMILMIMNKVNSENNKTRKSLNLVLSSPIKLLSPKKMFK